MDDLLAFGIPVGGRLLLINLDDLVLKVNQARYAAMKKSATARQAERRANETPEQRKERLAYDHEYHHKHNRGHHGAKTRSVA